MERTEVVHDEAWHKAEAEYRDFIEKVRVDKTLRGGPDTGRRIAELFDAYPHDYDLSKSPLEGLDLRLFEGTKKEV